MNVQFWHSPAYSNDVGHLIRLKSDTNPPDQNRHCYNSVLNHDSLRRLKLDCAHVYLADGEGGDICSGQTWAVNSWRNLNYLYMPSKLYDYSYIFRQ